MSSTLLRRKPRSIRPWMNAERVPFEALKERSRVSFGGFRPLKHVEGPRLRAVTHFGVQARALVRGAPLSTHNPYRVICGLFCLTESSAFRIFSPTETEFLPFATHNMGGFSLAGEFRPLDKELACAIFGPACLGLRRGMLTDMGVGQGTTPACGRQGFWPLGSIVYQSGRLMG